MLKPGAHLATSLVAQAAAEPRNVVRVGDDDAAFAGRDLFVGVEGEGRRVAKATELRSPESSSQSLARVVNDFQAVSVGDVLNGVPVRRVAEDIDRHDRFSA